ncbi:ketoacyl-synthetase C-terminal extension domain-containing protein, partial [Nocardiopsis mangrovi]
AGAVELLGEAREWPETGRPRRVGVSSFGVSGTNAHLILEHDPLTDAAQDHTGAADDDADTETSRAVGGAEHELGPEEDSAHEVLPYVLSGRGAEGLRGQADRLAEHLAPSADPSDQPRSPLRDVARSLATTRAVLRNRAVVVARDREAAVAGLRAFARGEEAPELVTGAPAPGGVGVLFAGQGSQWVGMGRGLYGAFPVFAEAFDEVCGALDGALGGCVDRGV